MQDRLQDPPPSAYGPDAVVTALLPAFLARYGAPVVNATQLNASAAAASQVADELTDAQLGLMYFNPKNPDGSVWRPEDAAIQLNGWAVWMVQQAAAGDGGKVGGQGGRALGGPPLRVWVPILTCVCVRMPLHMSQAATAVQALGPELRHARPPP